MGSGRRCYGDEADTLYDKIYHFETYHFELGDTVQLVDFALYQKKCLKAKERIEQEFEKLQKEAGMTQDSGEIEMQKEERLCARSMWNMSRSEIS